MTFTKTKNTTIVFAFAAMMMAMPLATTNAFGEAMDASLNPTCGFTVTSAADINFGAFSRTNDAATVGEEDAVFPAVVGSVASARMSISTADWYGTGTRASGTATLASASVGDTVTIGAVDYDAIAGATSGTDWDQRGNDIQDAEQLAKAIRENQAAVYKTSNSGTNVVTVNTVARGSATVVFTEDTTGSRIITADSAANTGTGVLNGGSATPQKIMNFDNTKFIFDKDAAVNTSYASKHAPITLTTAQEELGGTDPTDNVYLAIMINPATATYTNLPYDGPLTQEITITVDTACNGT